MPSIKRRRKKNVLRKFVLAAELQNGAARPFTLPDKTETVQITFQAMELVQNHLHSNKEVDYGPALNSLIGTFREQFLDVLNGMKTADYKNEIQLQIASQNERNLKLKASIEDLEKQVQCLIKNGVQRLSTGFTKIGMNITSSAELLDESRDTVFTYRELRRKSNNVEKQIVDLENQQQHLVLQRQREILDRYGPITESDNSIYSLSQRGIPAERDCLLREIALTRCRHIDLQRVIFSIDIEIETLEKHSVDLRRRSVNISATELANYAFKDEEVQVNASCESDIQDPIAVTVDELALAMRSALRKYNGNVKRERVSNKETRRFPIKFDPCKDLSNSTRMQILLSSAGTSDGRNNSESYETSKDSVNPKKTSNIQSAKSSRTLAGGPPGRIIRGYIRKTPTWSKKNNRLTI